MVVLVGGEGQPQRIRVVIILLLVQYQHFRDHPYHQYCVAKINQRWTANQEPTQMTRMIMKRRRRRRRHRLPLLVEELRAYPVHNNSPLVVVSVHRVRSIRTNMTSQ